ncbi:Uncharacterized protein APZ42_033396 [Daphnia magna]|uniref:Uncharacterized protein n=1 Tax=Daphnia magna TaxID=35525 RepID=A0A164L4P8_9CRUS|nr:Uncharacterized protein APZ42_033396 [Daphnia magna]
MEFVPTTMLDAMCQYHDLVYQNRPNSLERDYDKEFKIMVDMWAQANAGDGWTGPTHFERNRVIPLIKTIFAMKYAIGSESPWTKALMPSLLKGFFKDYKLHLKDNWSDGYLKLSRVKESPLISMDKMYDNSFMSIRKHRGDPAYQALNDTFDAMEDKRTREDDIEEEGENKQPKLEIEETEERGFIRPASPDIARRVGEEALTNARDTPRSSEIENKDNMSLQRSSGTQTQEVQTAKKGGFEGSGTEFVGGVTILDWVLLDH